MTRPRLKEPYRRLGVGRAHVKRAPPYSFRREMERPAELPCPGGITAIEVRALSLASRLCILPQADLLALGAAVPAATSTIPSSAFDGVGGFPCVAAGVHTRVLCS